MYAPQRTIGEGRPPAGVLVVEANSGIIRSVNDHLCRLFRYKKEHMIGANVKMLMEDAYAEEHDRYAQIHLAAGIKTVTRRRRRSIPFNLTSTFVFVQEVATARIVSGKRSDGSLVKLRLGLSLEPSATCPLVCALMEEL